MENDHSRQSQLSMAAAPPLRAGLPTNMQATVPATEFRSRSIPSRTPGTRNDSTLIVDVGYLQSRPSFAPSRSLLPPSEKYISTTVTFSPHITRSRHPARASTSSTPRHSRSIMSRRALVNCGIVQGCGEAWGESLRSSRRVRTKSGP